jgi:hypothetical protein
VGAKDKTGGEFNDRRLAALANDRFCDSGHLVPPIEFIKEILAWLDTYLGPVN